MGLDFKLLISLALFLLGNSLSMLVQCFLLSLYVLLLVLSPTSSTPLPESNESETAASPANGNSDEPVFLLMDDEPSEIFLLDVIPEGKQDKQASSDVKEATSDAKEAASDEKEGSERFLFKKFLFTRPVPVPVLPVAVLQPQVPQVVRVPSSFFVVVGAHKPHVYALRPPHYRPALISTGLPAGLTGGLTATSLLPTTAIGVQQQPLAVENPLTAALPQAARPPSVSGVSLVQPQPVPSPSLLSGMFTNLMSLGAKLPTTPVQPTPSLPIFHRPTMPPPTAINLQIQKVVDVMAHAKESESKEN